MVLANGYVGYRCPIAQVLTKQTVLISQCGWSGDRPDYGQETSFLRSLLWLIFAPLPSLAQATTLMAKSSWNGSIIGWKK